MILLEGHERPVSAVAFAADGSLLVSGDQSGTIAIWDPPHKIQTLSLHARAISAITSVPSGERLASSGSDGRVHIFDARSGRIQKRIGPLPGSVNVLGPISQNQLLAGIGDWSRTVALPSTLFLVDADSGRCRRLPFYVMNGVLALSSVPELKLAAWVTDNYQLTVQDISRPPVQSRPLPTCRAVALSADGGRLAASSGWKILLSSVAAWRQRPRELGSHRGMVTTLAFSPDGRRLFSGGMDGIVRVWDPEATLELMSFEWPIGHRINALAVSPDGLRAAVGGSNGKIVIWDLD